KEKESAMPLQRCRARRRPVAVRERAPDLSPVFAAELDRLAPSLDAENWPHAAMEMLAVLLTFDGLWQQEERGTAGGIWRRMQERHGWSRQAADQLALTWLLVAGLRDLDRLRAPEGEPRKAEGGRLLKAEGGRRKAEGWDPNGESETQRPPGHPTPIDI